MDTFYVKFESWSKDLYAKPKFILSYCRWNRFRDIPLHARNLNTLKQIEEACGGFIEVAKETIEKSELIEALIKIEENYTGFILANIKIIDEEGCEFIVHSVTHVEDKWLRERNIKVHGSFTRKAVVKFDEYIQSRC